MGNSEVTAEPDADGFDDRWRGAIIERQHCHFHRRLLARYGIVLGPGEFSKIVTDIKCGEALVLRDKQGRLEVYLARVESARRSIFVGASRGGRLFTALPPVTRFYRLKRAAKVSAKQNATEKV